ncbi:hypothetical protein BE20_12675 [Sorangium cellulosum]|uniref:Serpin domain-containing protein n=1 Tax=Sorangium cellulosum TaxID=56 RepID=A0A150SID5_SORCE|nr:hypothetical protein BE18_51860 [Sorangium cellulosum]KYF92120.1 hypothetical protein BE20_12675 [Sorangium cellulosum]
MPITMCATLAEPHAPGTDLVFCVPLALAWRKLQDRFGPLRFDPQPFLADALNRVPLDEVIDPTWCVSGAGFGAEGILERLRSELHGKFPDADPRLLPSSLAPDALLAYGYLSRDLRFPTPFALRDVCFQGQYVRAFGINDGPHPDNPARCAQVIAHDYVSSDEFVIELCAGHTEDRVLIAQIPPCSRLGVTVGAALERLERLRPGDRALRSDEELSIPRLQLEVNRRFDELVHRPLCNQELQGKTFDEVHQLVKFKLDEAGARVTAEAVMHGYGVPTPKRYFIVRKPFLLMLIRRSAPIPYLALWVETTAWMQEQPTPVPPALPTIDPSFWPRPPPR